MDKKFVYADNAATTRVSKQVLDAMLPYYRDHWGNPSAVYSIAAESKAAIDTAREQVAKAINAESDEIFFVSCGTEANNWAIKGAAAAKRKKCNHFISTPFEHHAVLHSLDALERDFGTEVTYLPVYDNGIIKMSDLEKSITSETALVTIMYANNEIGSIQPIAEIGELCHSKGVLFHTDAVQAVGHIPIDVKAQNIDMLSMSAHKFHGPKGCGVLYVRRSVQMPNFMDGGGQERKKRAGTENVAQIVGLGAAIEIACGKLDSEAARLSSMRDRLIDGLLAKIPHCRVNGDRVHRLPGNANVSIELIEGESMLMLLDMSGICAASGSACTSGSLTPSHVLTSIGLPAEIAHGSLRMTFAEESTEADIDYILEVLPGVVERLRAMSPLAK